MGPEAGGQRLGVTTQGETNTTQLGWFWWSWQNLEQGPQPACGGFNQDPPKSFFC